MSGNKKKDNPLNFDGFNSSFAEIMKEIFKDEPDYLSADDIDKALGVSSEPADPIFIGQYYCETSRNRIILPIKNITVWAIVETFEDDLGSGSGKTRILLSNDISKLRIDNIKIIESGECVIDERGMWKLPEPVIQLLDSDRLILDGLFTYAELLSLENYEKAEVKLYERLHKTDDKI